MNKFENQRDYIRLIKILIYLKLYCNIFEIFISTSILVLKLCINFILMFRFFFLKIVYSINLITA